MKNDITYEYRVFTNRLIDVEHMEVGICTSKVIAELKSKDKVDGRFFHTSDTDEWFFCWHGELQKLNLKGDSDVNDALAEVKKLIADANAAVDDAKKTATEAKDAATKAQVAADAANAAVENIDNKADKSEVEQLAQEVNKKAAQTAVDELSEKVDAIEIPSLDGYATKEYVDGKIDGKFDAAGTAAGLNAVMNERVTALEDSKQNKIDNLETIIKNANLGATALQEVPAEYVTETELKEQVDTKQNIISDLDDIRSGAALGATALQSVPEEYVTETELTNKGYATTTQVEAKQDKVDDLETIRSGAALGATALQSVPEEYITNIELDEKGYLTENAADLKYALKGSTGSGENIDLSEYATKEFVGEEIAKIDIPKIPTKVSEFENDANYLTKHQDISGKQDKIDNLETIIKNANLGATALQKEVADTLYAPINSDSDGIDLSDYVTKEDIEDYAKTSDLETVYVKNEVLENYYTKDYIDSLIGEAVTITNTILNA